jgi:hypothetical protein
LPDDWWARGGGIRAERKEGRGRDSEAEDEIEKKK